MAIQQNMYTMTVQHNWTQWQFNTITYNRNSTQCVRNQNSTQSDTMPIQQKLHINDTSTPPDTMIIQYHQTQFSTTGHNDNSTPLDTMTIQHHWTQWQFNTTRHNSAPLDTMKIQHHQIQFSTTGHNNNSTTACFSNPSSSIITFSPRLETELCPYQTGSMTTEHLLWVRCTHYMTSWGISSGQLSLAPVEGKCFSSLDDLQCMPTLVQRTSVSIWVTDEKRTFPPTVWGVQHLEHPTMMPLRSIMNANIKAFLLRIHVA